MPPPTPVACPRKKRRTVEPPEWFQTFAEEERKRQDAWREEMRAHFLKIEKLQTERVNLLREAVSAMKKN